MNNKKKININTINKNYIGSGIYKYNFTKKELKYYSYISNFNKNEINIDDNIYIYITKNNNNKYIIKRIS